jgi:hypothetical protein
VNLSVVVRSTDCSSFLRSGASFQTHRPLWPATGIPGVDSPTARPCASPRLPFRTALGEEVRSAIKRSGSRHFGPGPLWICLAQGLPDEDNDRHLRENRPPHWDE